MPDYKVKNGYDVLYGATQAEARNWSPVRLTISLNLMLTKGPGDEARWGAKDAITDLMGGIAPPVWRQEMH